MNYSDTYARTTAVGRTRASCAASRFYDAITFANICVHIRNIEVRQGPYCLPDTLSKGIGTAGCNCGGAFKQNSGDILPPPNRRVSKKQQIEQREHYQGTRRSSSQVHEQMHRDQKYGDQQSEQGNEQAYVLNDTDQVIAATIVDITPIDDMTRL